MPEETETPEYEKALQKYFDEGINYDCPIFKGMTIDDIQQFAADSFHAGALFANTKSK